MKICTFNVENFVVGPLEKDEKGQVYKKAFIGSDTSLKKLQQIADVLRDIDADIYALTEVHSEQCLREFNHYFLDDRYKIGFIEGNSDRGIHIAYLVKKSFPYRLEQLTHRRRPIATLSQNRHLYMARDIAELRVYRPDQEHTPSMILLAVHLKSKRTERSADFGGKRHRAQEFALLLKTYQILNDRYKGQVPILLLGDFNGILRPDALEEEFAQLYEETDLKDILDILRLDPLERITQMSFNRHRELMAEQFDYIFLPPVLHPFINTDESGVYRFRQSNGNPMALPNSPEQRSNFPSDHFPVVVSLTKTF